MRDAGGLSEGSVLQQVAPPNRQVTHAGLVGAQHLRELAHTLRLAQLLVVTGQFSPQFRFNLRPGLHDVLRIPTCGTEKRVTHMT
ncbi:hypothetical protein GCM10010121_061380 [Streptomyces brasiliensis]|uniref:Uncharacterized protein n=1 Tax=Streptomyces brasiliensis TaxID=1954 RepID=A0A917NYY2_9ACTN|nr:hypothetical protein GCM10010121_061380 [Streptomyces brasiliensis]